MKYMSFLKFTAIAFSLTTLFYSCEEFSDLDDIPLTEEEVAKGLKAALERGTEIAVDTLNIEDGYFGDEIVKIFLPPEADPILATIEKVPGGTTLVENTILAVNRSAEQAAEAATPIFVDAITGLSIEDALNILHGVDTAATGYLHTQTYNALYDAFYPSIETSLNTEIVLGASAASLYEDLIDAYNKVANISFGLLNPVTENNLSAYTTTKALDGLFIKVADEEMRIRTDVSHRVNDILQKVFAELD